MADIDGIDPAVGPQGDADQRATEEREALGAPVRPRSQEDFERSYEGQPPWDIGRPQTAFADLSATGGLTGRVLDVGCGTGEHVLMAAEAGHDATGIDLAPSALAVAERKARDRGLAARFLVHDALDLASLDGPFETVLDSGLFHVLSDDDRVRYVQQLGVAVAPEGRCHVLCFSDRQPGEWGPRRVSEQELRACFTTGWRVEAVVPTIFEVNLYPGRAEAWLLTAIRA